MTSHEIDYTIYGDDLQAVEIELDPQETVVAEAGAMNWMESDAFEPAWVTERRQAQAFLGGLMSMGKRVLTGESLFMTHFTNQGVAKRRVAFSSPYPGKIMPVDLGQLEAPSCTKRRVSLRRERNKGVHRVHQADRRWILRRRGLHSAKAGR